MSRQWLAVCTVDDLQPDSGVCIKVAEQQIALFYLSQLQKVYALANFDPIGQANVLSRGMIGDLAGEPMVASPLYKQHYSLKTGVCFEYDDVCVQTYPVCIDDQRVMIHVELNGCVS